MIINFYNKLQSPLRFSGFPGFHCLFRVVAVSDRHPPCGYIICNLVGLKYRTFVRGALGLCKQVIPNLNYCRKDANIHGMFGQQCLVKIINCLKPNIRTS